MFRTQDTTSSDGWHPASNGSSNPIPWLSADKQKYDANGLKDSESLALDGGVKLMQSVEGNNL